MNKHGFMSVTEFAKKHQISRQAVIKAVKANRVFAFRVGNFWVIGDSEFKPKK